MVNDAPNNTMVSDNEFIEFTAPTPQALADRLIAMVDRADAVEYSRRASESVGSLGWDGSGAQFVRAVEDVLRG